MQKLPLLNIGGVKDIENKSFFRELLVLALPISLQNLLVFSIAIVDGMMLSALGDTAVSSAYVGNQMQALLQIVTVGFEGAILVIAAQHHGTGNRESVKKVSGIGTGVCLAFGLLFTLSSLFFPGIIASVFTKNSEILGSSAE